MSHEEDSPKQQTPEQTAEEIGLPPGWRAKIYPRRDRRKGACYKFWDPKGIVYTSATSLAAVLGDKLPPVLVARSGQAGTAVAIEDLLTPAQRDPASSAPGSATVPRAQQQAAAAPASSGTPSPAAEEQCGSAAASSGPATACSSGASLKEQLDGAAAASAHSSASTSDPQPEEQRASSSTASSPAPAAEEVQTKGHAATAATCASEGSWEAALGLRPYAGTRAPWLPPGWREAYKRLERSGYVRKVFVSPQNRVCWDRAGVDKTCEEEAPKPKPPPPGETSPGHLPVEPGSKTDKEDVEKEAARKAAKKAAKDAAKMKRKKREEMKRKIAFAGKKKPTTRKSQRERAKRAHAAAKTAEHPPLLQAEAGEAQEPQVHPPELPEDEAARKKRKPSVRRGKSKWTPRAVRTASSLQASTQPPTAASERASQDELPCITPTQDPQGQIYTNLKELENALGELPSQLSTVRKSNKPPKAPDEDTQRQQTAEEMGLPAGWRAKTYPRKDARRGCSYKFWDPDGVLYSSFTSLKLVLGDSVPVQLHAKFQGGGAKADDSVAELEREPSFATTSEATSQEQTPTGSTCSGPPSTISEPPSEEQPGSAASAPSTLEQQASTPDGCKPRATASEAPLWHPATASAGSRPLPGTSEQFAQEQHASASTISAPPAAPGSWEEALNLRPYAGTRAPWLPPEWREAYKFLEKCGRIRKCFVSPLNKVCWDRAGVEKVLQEEAAASKDKLPSGQVQEESTPGNPPEREEEKEDATSKKASSDKKRKLSDGKKKKKESEAKKAKGEESEAKKAKGEESEAKRARGEESEAKKARGEESEAKRAKGEELEAKKAKGEESEAKRAKGEELEAKKAKGEESEAKRARGEESEAKRARGEESEAKKARGEESEAKRARGEESEAKKARGEESEAKRAKGEELEAKKAKGEESEAKRVKDEESEAKRAKSEESEAKPAKGDDANVEEQQQQPTEQPVAAEPEVQPVEPMVVEAQVQAVVEPAVVEAQAQAVEPAVVEAAPPAAAEVAEVVRTQASSSSESSDSSSDSESPQEEAEQRKATQEAKKKKAALVESVKASEAAAEAAAAAAAEAAAAEDQAGSRKWQKYWSSEWGLPYWWNSRTEEAVWEDPGA